MRTLVLNAGYEPLAVVTFRRALVLVLTGNTTVAKPLAQKLLAASPRDFELLYINGVLEHDAGDSKSAREHLKQAVAVDPEFAMAHASLGRMYGEVDAPDLSSASIRRACSRCSAAGTG